MTKRSVEAIVDALNAAGVRYLIAGGLAVVAHGYVRLAYQAAARLEVAPGVEAVFVGYRDLLRLKEHAGRATDIEDIRRLRVIHEDAGE